MELIWRVCGGTLCFLLLVLRSAKALPGFNNAPEPNLTCWFDYIDLAHCEFDGQQCSQHNLSLESDYVNESCNFRPCGSGQCCCSTAVKVFMGEKINATVWRGGKRVVSRDINVTYSIKPKAPTIVSVKQSNGNFQLKWKSNMEAANVVDSDLEAVVTYYKKGDTSKFSKQFKPASKEQQKLKFHEIAGRDLEPSTTYVVSVTSYLSWSKLFSDPSEELEFTTPMPYYTIPVIIVVLLSICSVIFMGAIYCCCYKAKAMWWDGAIIILNPKLLDMHPTEKKLLKPSLPYISSVCVEPPIQDYDKPWSKGLKESSDGSSEGSGEVNSGSTLLSYANTAPVDVKAGVLEALGNTFANIGPLPLIGSSPFSSPATQWESRSINTSSASSGIDNKTYLIAFPGSPLEIPATGTAGIECDSAYQAQEGPAGVGCEQLLPAPLMLCHASPSSSLMQTDMSYQQCQAEPAPSVSSFSTVLDDPPPCPDDGHSCNPGKLAVQLTAEAVMVCDQNPCYGAVPAGSCDFLPVEDGYQPFQSQVVQPGSSCSEEPSGDHLERISAPCFPLPTSVQVGSVSAEVQRPFLQLLSAGPAVITESDYQSV